MCKHGVCESICVFPLTHFLSVCLFVGSCPILSVFVFFYSSPDIYSRKSANLDENGGMENIVEVGEEETIIRTYCMKKYF